MALRRARQPRKASITSLIDVIFLLLLFFMLASTFTDRVELELVASPVSGPAAEIESASLRLDVGARLLVLEGAPVRLGALARAVSDKAGPHGAVLAVNPAGDVDSERLVAVLLALRDTESITIRVVEPAP